MLCCWLKMTPNWLWKRWFKVCQFYHILSTSEVQKLCYVTFTTHKVCDLPHTSTAWERNYKMKKRGQEDSVSNCESWSMLPELVPSQETTHIISWQGAGRSEKILQCSDSYGSCVASGSANTESEQSGEVWLLGLGPAQICVLPVWRQSNHRDMESNCGVRVMLWCPFIN